MAETLESLGYFKQELIKAYSSGRKVYKGISLHTKEVVLIQELTFERTLQAQVYSQEIRRMQVLAHQAAGRVLGCVLAASRCYVVGEFLPVALEEEQREWNEEEIWQFLELFLELFAEAEAKGVFYRNVAPDCFRVVGKSYHFCEFSGYYYLKEPLAYISPAVLYYLSASDDEESLGSGLPFHNPYKSEVYSLAMVVLGLMTAKPLPDILPNEVAHKAAISLIFDEIQCSERLKNVLFQMVKYSEETRLDPYQALLYMKGELDMSNSALFLKQHHDKLAVIEARMQPQLTRSNTMRKYAVLSCVCCLVPIRIGANTAVEELEVLLMLKCPAKNHLFCGVECMMKFAFIQTEGNYEDIDKLKCPICQYSLPPELHLKIQEKWDITSVLSLKHSASHLSEPETSSLDLRASCPSLLRVVSADIDPSSRCQASCSDKNEVIDSKEEIQMGLIEGRLSFEVEISGSNAPKGNQVQSVIQEIRSYSVIDFPPDCGRCGNLVDLTSSSGTRPVFLYCSPADHVFCSKQCLRNYAESCMCSFLYDIDKVTCPKCFQPIERALVLDSFDGVDNFVAIQEAARREHIEEHLCMECRTNAGAAALCGHIFCDQCKSGWELIATKGEMPCPVCNQPIACRRQRQGMFRTIVDYAKSTIVGE